LWIVNSRFFLLFLNQFPKLTEVFQLWIFLSKHFAELRYDPGYESWFWGDFREQDPGPGVSNPVVQLEEPELEEGNEDEENWTHDG
jgi:hypothetical protein